MLPNSVSYVDADKVNERIAVIKAFDQVEFSHSIPMESARETSWNRHEKKGYLDH